VVPETIFFIDLLHLSMIRFNKHYTIFLHYYEQI